MVPELHTYRARVTGIAGSATLRVDVDLGFHTWLHGVILRLHGLQAPLDDPADPGQQAAGRAVRAWLARRLVDEEVVVQVVALDGPHQARGHVFVGPNGVGKTMLSKNLAHRALLQGHSVRFTTASAMLNALAAEDSASALERRLRRLCRPRVLCIDEVGYLSYGNRHADLLFEVVARRYEVGKPVVVTTNKAFREWNEVFPNATCVVTLVDRLVHRSEVVQIEGDSFRLKEAQERKTARSKGRRSKS